MTAKHPNRTRALPCRYLLRTCVLMALAAAALHLSSRVRSGALRSSHEQALMACLGRMSGSAANADSAKGARGQQGVTSASLPLAFERNQEQTDPEVKYLARGKGYAVFLTDDGLELSLATPTKLEGKGRKLMGRGSRAPAIPVAVLGIQMVGANSKPEVAGGDKLPGVINYYIGNDPSKWRTNVPQYARVEYHDVYPGVDLAFHGE